jgi:hypothetical protein
MHPTQLEEVGHCSNQKKIYCPPQTINRRNTQGMDIREIQVYEIRTLTGHKKKVSWIFSTMGVWSRFWPGTVFGSRNHENTKPAIRSISKLKDPQHVRLIVTDRYKFYEWAIRKCL